MTALDREQWHRITPHLDRALDLIPGEREAWLAALRKADASLATDVDDALTAHCALDRERFLEREAPSAAAPRACAGDRVGAYTLVEPIGQGGTANVWRAVRSDGRFEGQAAVKLLSADPIGPAGSERLRQEASMLARLTHPHIVRLADAGTTTSGQPYLVLEHVEGRQIDHYCDERGLGVDARLRLFVDVLSAVAHVHAHHIVHADLKPSNLLVTNDGEVKLLDFGAAIWLDGGSGSRRSTPVRDASTGFTPMFAAPEQTSGGPVTTAADVYGLGMLLYRLLSGHHPGGSGGLDVTRSSDALVDEPRRMSSVVADRREAFQVLEQHAARRSTTPDALRRRLRGDLDAIAAKALRKRPHDRYVSVMAYAEDVRRSLEGQPVQAQPGAFHSRLRQFIRPLRPR